MAETIRFSFVLVSADEARSLITSGLSVEPTATRKLYAALAYKVWSLLVANAPEDEIRDWHDVVLGAAGYIGDRDVVAKERIKAIADLLRESVSSYTTFGVGNKIARAPAATEI